MVASVKLTGGGKLLTQLKKMAKKGRVSAGFYKGSKYPNGKSVAEVAYINNFGTLESGGFIPPRPFFDDAISENKDKWVKGFANRLKSNNYDIDNALNRVGEQMRSDIIRKIDVNDYEPNSPKTIEKSGNPNKEPLKDTYHMMRSVGYQVNDESPQYSSSDN